jgi:S1-C subfamily serine protease
MGGVATAAFAYREMSAGRGQTAGANGDAPAAPAGSFQAQDDRPLSDQGVLIMHVDPESPAAGAGLRRGSIILAVNGTAVNSPRELREAIGALEAGETVTLTALVCDAPQDIEVTLESAGPYLGVDVGGPEFGVTPGVEGFGGFAFPAIPGHGGPGFANHPAVIGEVVTGSPAEEAGLQVGDVVTALDGEPVESYLQLAERIGAYSPGDTVALTIERDGESQTVSATLGEHPDDANLAYLGVSLAPLMPFFHEFELPEAVPAPPLPDGNA